MQVDVFVAERIHDFNTRKMGSADANEPEAEALSLCNEQDQLGHMTC